MYGDLSRLTFRPDRHYSAVVAQQGRVTLDADVNEQAALERHYGRTLATDLIGPYAGPAGALGFLITPSSSGSGGNEVPSLTIGPGRYYVGGVLCELEAPADYHSQPNVPAAAGLPKLESGVAYVVYLKVWERYVSIVEAPSLREVALGLNGPDTTGRLQVVWQVLVYADPDLGQVKNQRFYDNYWPKLEPTLLGRGTGRLKAQATQTADVASDVCVLPSSSGYRGPENQLYRVEIHRGGTVSPPSGGTTGSPSPTPVLSVPPVSPNGGPADAAPADDADAEGGDTQGMGQSGPPTFMWSRDNGSLVFPVTQVSGAVVSVAALGRDPKLSLEVGDYVQIVDDAYEAQGAPGPLQLYAEPLHLVQAIDPIARTVTLDAVPSTNVENELTLHPFLRRWDQQEALVLNGGLMVDAQDNAIQIIEGTWIDLEDGVQIWFEPGGTYAAGDYWLIPARVATGDVEWPRQAATATTAAGPALLPQFGVYYQLAPLAVVSTANAATDMRWEFEPLRTLA